MMIDSSQRHCVGTSQSQIQFCLQFEILVCVCVWLYIWLLLLQTNMVLTFNVCPPVCVAPDIYAIRYNIILLCFSSNNVQQRAFWYIVSSALEDDEIQRRGMVMIVYDVGAMLPADQTTAFNFGKLMSFILPIRIAGFHICSNEPQRVTALRKLLLGSQSRLRTRCHDGMYYHLPSP